MEMLEFIVKIKLDGVWLLVVMELLWLLARISMKLMLVSSRQELRVYINGMVLVGIC